MRSESISALEHDARRVMRELSRDKTAVILGDDGTPAAYLVDPATYDAALHRLDLLEALSKSENDVAEGRILSHAEVKQKMAKWLK